MILVYNSDVLPESSFQFAADDRAFQYGDGLFETIRYEHNCLWFWPDHFDRLTAGMAALNLNPPANFSEASINQSIFELLSTNELTHQAARIKIQVWRRSGGLYTPATNDANVLITVRPGQSFQITAKPKIGIYDKLRLSLSPISAFKTLNSLPYVLAGIHKLGQNLDDVLLLDTSGHLAECVASNLFWFQNGTLYTPSLQTGCINGIARRQLLRSFPLTEQGLFQPDVLNKADVVFAANVMGIQVFHGHFSDPFAEQIQQIFTRHSAN